MHLLFDEPWYRCFDLLLSVECLCSSRWILLREHDRGNKTVRSPARYDLGSRLPGAILKKNPLRRSIESDIFDRSYKEKKLQPQVHSTRKPKTCELVQLVWYEFYPSTFVLLLAILDLLPKLLGLVLRSSSPICWLWFPLFFSDLAHSSTIPLFPSSNYDIVKQGSERDSSSRSWSTLQDSLSLYLALEWQLFCLIKS